MQTGYFILLLIGFAWLALWSVQPRLSSKPGWWPFDMRADLDGRADPAPATAMSGRRRGIAVASAPLGNAQAASTPEGQPPDDPLPDAAPATGQTAWRQRRDRQLSGNRRPGR